jgi:hypothetical protein
MVKLLKEKPSKLHAEKFDLIGSKSISELLNKMASQ